jgi:hypothetical protein
MKQDRIGKVVRAAGPTEQTQELEMICVGVAPSPGALDAMGSVQSAVELEDLDDNPKIKRFRAKALDQVEYVADCDFLRNIIKVLIQNHNITITPQDLEGIFGVWGDVVVNTRIEHFIERDVDIEPGCCGCSKAQQEKAVEVIKSILLNGLNVAKSLPDIVKFLSGMGLNI